MKKSITITEDHTAIMTTMTIITVTVTATVITTIKEDQEDIPTLIEEEDKLEDANHLDVAIAADTEQYVTKAHPA